jgi:hypothetical protein
VSEIYATTFLLILILSTFFTCLIGCFTNAEGLEFVNPIWLYKKYKVNWFGAGLITILFNILSLPFAFCYWFYKLCTVGRKDNKNGF